MSDPTLLPTFAVAGRSASHTTITATMMKKQYRDIFLDFDDTLYDTYGNAVIALAETFDAFRLGRYFDEPQVFYDAYWQANIELWGQYSRGEITRDYLITERFRRPLMVSERFSNTYQHPTLLSKEISDRFLDFCSCKTGVVDGAHELMDYLSSQGYHIHMCSNGFHEVQYKKLQACGLRPFFNTVILSEDAGANKPSERFFDYALSQTGASRETTVMIGDNLQTDIMGAKAAGIDTIFFNRDPDSEKSDEPTHTVTSLLQIKDIL